MRYYVMRFFYLTICWSLVSCNETDPFSEKASQDSGQVAFNLKLGKIAASSLARTEVVITAPGMSEIRRDLLINGNTVSGTIQEIPVGKDRLFTLNGYDSEEKLLYTGSARADINQGEMSTVEIFVKWIGIPKLRIEILWPSRHSDTNTTDVYGDIENIGDGDAVDVLIACKAQASYHDIGANSTLDRVARGEKTRFVVTFEGTSIYTSYSSFVTGVDYTVSFKDITGKELPRVAGSHSF